MKNIKMIKIKIDGYFHMINKKMNNYNKKDKMINFINLIKKINNKLNMNIKSYINQ